MKSLTRKFSAIILITGTIGLTACVANDENKIGDYNNTKNVELPSEKNGYIVKVVPGETVIIDLNGDGEDEIINYSLKKVHDDSYSYYKVNNLTISGVEYAKEDSENPLGSLGMNIYYPDVQWYFIVDIDASDDYKEIAIADAGPSDDPTTSFLRYDGSELEYIGYVTGYPTDDTYSMDGKGTIHSKGRLDLLQYWTAIFTWKLGSEGKLVSVEQDLYSPISYDSEENNPVLLKQEIKAYTEKNLSSKTIVMEPSDQPITFPLTDNKNWVLMHREDGTEGWLYIENYINIVSDGYKLNSAYVFDNLFFAD